MSTPSELVAVRERFIQLLRTDPQTANRIANILALQYADRMRRFSIDVLMYAAEWAAQRYATVPPDILRKLGAREIVDIVKRSDCPLCMGDADESGGTGSTHTPAAPVGTTA